jgi:hypothetical protein
MIQDILSHKHSHLFTTNNQISYKEDGESAAKRQKLDSDSCSPASKTTSNFVEKCYECNNPIRDPKPEELVMYLHAYKYAVS